MSSKRAQSHYRQVRLTITEEEGYVSLRVLVKPLAESWAVKHSVYHHRVRRTKHSNHWVNLIAWALDVIASERLPEP